MNWKKSLIIPSILLSCLGYSQVLISDSDFDAANPCDCAVSFLNNATPNFFDTGNNSANYGDNESEVITFCPDGDGSKITLAVGNNAGFTWDVDGSDTLFVYDGPTNTSPLIVAANSVTHPGGMSSGLTTASWANTSGCLTIEFVSDAAVTGTGWEANVSCSSPWQPMEIHLGGLIGLGEANGAGDNTDDFTNDEMTGALPDTGYVNVCLGDSVMLVNKTIYPYEPDSPSVPNPGQNGVFGADAGGGYNQSLVGNHLTEWTFSDGTVATGDTTWFTPSSTTGYFVSMRVTDNALQYDEILGKIRVSTVPSFATCMATEPEICLGAATSLIGGITPGDTAGVDAVGSAFQIQGSFGAQTFLPDGSGQNYTTDISISGFPAGLTLQNAGDLESVCISMEHSYLGDLEMVLSCPNGQDVVLFNSYSGFGGGELVNGGFSGGSDYLGGANDINSTVGECEEYCFSELTGALPSWDNGYPTVTAGNPAGASVTPGDYNPEGSYVADLSGCPLNGTWTLTVRDNLTQDDGWICEWGIFFNANLNPNNETYAPTIVSEEWLPDPTIIVGSNDTAVVVSPFAVGTYGYTFQVEDNFGCSYDTTINVEVIQGPTLTPNVSTCDDDFGFDGTHVTSPNNAGGVWSYSGNGTGTFSPSNSFIYPTFTPDYKGVYTITFVDNVCGDSLTSNLVFLDVPVASWIGTDTVCQNDTAILMTTLNLGETAVWTNSAGTIVSSDTILSISDQAQQGDYLLTITNACGSDSELIPVVIQSCEVPNVITPNGDGTNDAFYTRYADVYSDVNLIIYNRWGRVVYKTDSYQNDWEGEKTNGKPVNGGVYYYVMNWDGGVSNEAGHITVFDK